MSRILLRRWLRVGPLSALLTTFVSLATPVTSASAVSTTPAACGPLAKIAAELGYTIQNGLYEPGAHGSFNHSAVGDAKVINVVETQYALAEKRASASVLGEVKAAASEFLAFAKTFAVIGDNQSRLGKMSSAYVGKFDRLDGAVGTNFQQLADNWVSQNCTAAH